MKLLNFKDWTNENLTAKRPTKRIEDLGINRQFKKDPFTGDKYETELFAMFKRLQPRIQALEKKPNLEEWFEMMQNSDNQFYAMVQADELGQPDVRELWRDLTGQRASKMAKYGLAESLVDPGWKVEFTDDSGFDEFFSKFGIAFSHLEERMIYINSREFERLGLTQDHRLAIEAHEIAHGRLGHHGDFIDPIQERQADETAIEILRTLGHHGAADLLAERLVDEAKNFDITPSYSSDEEEADTLIEEYEAWVGPNGERIVGAKCEIGESWIDGNVKLSNGIDISWYHEWYDEIKIERLICNTPKGPVQMSEETISFLDDTAFDLQVEQNSDFPIRADYAIFFWACIQVSDRIPSKLLDGLDENHEILLMQLGLSLGPISERTAYSEEIPRDWMNHVILEKFG